MTYKVVLSQQAAKYLARLQRSTQRAIDGDLSRLADNPFAAGSHPLHGRLSGSRTWRAGAFRIIYEVRQEIVTVYVVSIGPRGDAYKS